MAVITGQNSTSHATYSCFDALPPRSKLKNAGRLLEKPWIPLDECWIPLEGRWEAAGNLIIECAGIYKKSL
jgi:hypothetical protein